MRPKKKTPRRPQSSELAGGAGFTFEDKVGAFYLTALLGEAVAPGISNRVVSRVAFQQREFGEPLDDVIVDFRTEEGEEARLSLQCKTDLRISAAKGNTDFREVVRDSWLTFKKPDFRKGIDRFGAAVENVAKASARALRRLCEAARESDTPRHFEMRFAKGGNANATQKEIRKQIVALVTVVRGGKPSADEVHEFLAAFTLIEFDFLHEGAVDTPEAITRLRECLVSDQAGQAPALWATLCRLKRESGGEAGVYTRERLLRAVAGVARLRGAISLRSDLDKVRELAKRWVGDIEKDVGGTHVARNKLVEQLKKARAESRFVQIVGLPGTGKSVFLREQVERDLDRGPMLFLKADRLEGKSWASFAASVGLSSAALPKLLAEIAATGADTFYVDGIDRVETEHRAIVRDVVQTIATDAGLSNWKIVVSLRDSGLEPLRSWLADALGGMSVGTVDVRGLDQEEAAVLAKAQPALWPLLAASSHVAEIARRPFFAKVLHRGFAAQNSQAGFQPRSEVDLIDHWWARGGYAASGQDAIARQRAILDIASTRSHALSVPVALSRLKSETVAEIQALIDDGILQNVKRGHTVRFSHDIFFEWSFFHVLVERDNEWLEEIAACGEPPAVARVVELLSQWKYGEGKAWSATLHLVARGRMRSQWTRAWLLGPIGIPTFEGKEEEFATTAFDNGFAFLKKALVWFQAEKTVPNANILAGDLPPDQRIRVADLLSWPSDFATWSRFIEFLLARVDSIPVLLRPQVVSIFEVWQNALAGLKNAVSSALLTKCAQWVREIDERQGQRDAEEGSPWQPLRDLDEFGASLRRLILRSASSEPAMAEEYVNRVLASKRVHEERYKEVMAFAPTLATTHPDLLVQLALKYLRTALPEALVAQDAERERKNLEMRGHALAKPESERTPRDEWPIDGGSVPFIPHQFSPGDWDNLCIDRSSNAYWPPSPLREPFYSLFTSAPKQGLALLRALSNHAVEAWRQLHRYDYRRQATPIPLEVPFPWGVQQFWGGEREYFWHRGGRAPRALASGYFALEEWWVAELARGRPVDDLIHEIVDGNDSVAVLGVAVALLLQTDHVSETGFSVLLSQRLWAYDWARMVHDRFDTNAALVGFERGDERHMNAIRQANVRSTRQRTLRWLVFPYLQSDQYAERAEQAGLAFRENLPFEYEEQKSDSVSMQHLLEQATEYSEVCSRANYRARKSKDREDAIEIFHVDPSASKPENVEKLQRATRSVQQGNLWAWASKSFENGRVAAGAALPEAIKLAKELDEPSLFEASEDAEEPGTRKGAVAGTAAVVLRFRDGRTDAELQWARSVLARALSAPESRDRFWSPQSVIPWHPAIFVARGLASEIRCGTAQDETGTDLLAIAAHPLENVALAALSEIASLWDVDAKFVWAAIHLAFDLSRLEPMPPGAVGGFGDPVHSHERTTGALRAAIECYEKGAERPPLPEPPAAWVKREEEQRNPKETSDDVLFVRSRNRRSGRTKGHQSGAWTEPETRWYSDYAAKVLAIIPFPELLASSAKDRTVAFLENLLEWTIAKIVPPWHEEGRRDRDATQLFAWTHQLGVSLADAAGAMTESEVSTRFLERIFALEDEVCWSLLRPFSSRYVCRYVYDAATLSDGTLAVVRLCLERLLKAEACDLSSRQGGEFDRFGQQALLETLMFVSVERADGAARYVNGDWSEIKRILPMVDRCIRVGGWSSIVMGHFLTLCERARTAYPADLFAEQILFVIGADTPRLKGWRGTMLPARIASLVQSFADRETPVALVLGQQLLRVLDLLVDMGDRRSAALQFSEVFREITV